MIWNEPNNKSHWDFEADPGWHTFAEMARLAGQAIKGETPSLPRVLGGISPIDPDFIRLMARHGVLDHMDAVAVHGFPLDWNHWMIDEWPAKIEQIRAVTHLPVWVSEVGVSSFGAEEVQEWGLRRTAGLLRGTVAAHPLVQSLRSAARPGPRRPGTRRPKARLTIGISTWGCWTSMAGPSWLRVPFAT